MFMDRFESLDIFKTGDCLTNRDHHDTIYRQFGKFLLINCRLPLNFIYLLYPTSCQ